MPVTRSQGRANLRLKKCDAVRRSVRQALACLLTGSVQLIAVAQTATPAAASDTQQRLQRLEQSQQALQRQLQENAAEIEALKKQMAASSPGASAPQGAAAAAATGAAGSQPAPPAAAGAAPAAVGGPVAVAAAAGQGTPPAPLPNWGTYTDFLGYKVANTNRGDMNIALYTYVRYLNQLGTDASYTNAFGQTSKLQRRQEVQILKVQIKFLGWILSPKLRYFLYAWSSNATQGQPAQVVLAGNLNYTFNKYLTLSGGITSLPGVRTTEGNFPFWLNVDNRMLSDEFMRPSYTSGFWVKGDITPGLRYQAMIGNNLSTLGVNSGQLNNHLDTLATALVWTPTTGEFGTGFGDFEDHQVLATRLGLHYTRSIEDKQSQPNTDGFENTQIRLSDGTVIFTPNIFGPGVTVNQLRYQMSTMDAGVKYHGMALEGEYYWRKLDQFEGPGTSIVPNRYDRGFQLQASMMAIPKRLQVYLAGSRVEGQYGNPWDTRLGVNLFPWKNRVFRWNAQVMYIYHSPSGYNSLTYNVGSTGWIFNTDFEMGL
jgi:hypothetical protein